MACTRAKPLTPSFQCKTVGTKHLTYVEFKLALAHVAYHLGRTVEEVSAAITASAGPVANGITLPEFVKFHDDRGMYTGKV